MGATECKLIKIHCAKLQCSYCVKHYQYIYIYRDIIIRTDEIVRMIKKFKINNKCNKRKECLLDTFSMQGRVRVSDTRYLQVAKRLYLNIIKNYNTAYTTYTKRTENKLISI